MGRTGAILRATVVIGLIGLAPPVVGEPLELVYKSLDLLYPVQDMGGPALQSGGGARDLKSEVVDLKSAGAEIKESDTEIKISLQGEILFDFDKANIRPAAEPVLTQVAEMIKKSKKINVLIEGHTDSKGSQSYNTKLSDRRAVSVKTWLVAHGIAERGITTNGLGASKPVAPNTKPDGSDDPEGRQKNRRVEITIRK